MSDAIRAPLIAGLTAGLAFILIFAILAYNLANNEAKTDSMIKAAETSPVAKAFLAKYPDALIKVETECHSHASYRTGLPAVSFSKTYESIAYFNKTAGSLIEDENVPIGNKTELISSAYNVRKFTGTILLFIHLDFITQHPDRILLGYYGEQLGTYMLLDRGEENIQRAKQIEKSMIQSIETYH